MTHRAAMLAQTDENQKRFWVRLAETGTFPQKPAQRHSWGGQGHRQSQPQTPSCFPSASGTAKMAPPGLSAPTEPPCLGGAGLLPAHSSVKPTRSAPVLVARAHSKGKRHGSVLPVIGSFGPSYTREKKHIPKKENNGSGNTPRTLSDGDRVLATAPTL